MCFVTKVILTVTNDHTIITIMFTKQCFRPGKLMLKWLKVVKVVVRFTFLGFNTVSSTLL